MMVELLEVLRLHAAYSHAIDHQDGPGFAALFAPNGTLVVPGIPDVTGAEALAEFCVNAPPGIHLVGLPHLDAAGRAHAPFTFTAGEAGRLVSGYYADDLTAGQDGRLLFQRRVVDLRVRWSANPLSQS